MSCKNITRLVLLYGTLSLLIMVIDMKPINIKLLQDISLQNPPPTQINVCAYLVPGIGFIRIF